MNVKKWIFSFVLFIIAGSNAVSVYADELEEETIVEEFMDEEVDDNEDNEIFEEGDSLLRELSDTEDDSELLEENPSLNELLTMLGAGLESNEEGSETLETYVLQVVENTDLNRRYYDEEKDVYFSGYEFYSYKLQVYMTVLLSIVCGMLIIFMFKCGGSHGNN